MSDDRDRLVDLITEKVMEEIRRVRVAADAPAGPSADSTTDRRSDGTARLRDIGFIVRGGEQAVNRRAEAPWQHDHPRGM